MAVAAAQNSSPSQPIAPPAPTAQPGDASPDAGSSVSITPETGSGQSQAEGGGGFVFRKQVQEVVLHAVVVDPQNQLLSSLPRDAFSVFEDGKRQTVTSFRQENVPLALGILIDNSGSMRPKRQKVNDAALNLIRSSNPQDQVFVVNFGEDFYLDQDFTDDVDKLKAALQRVETRGSTALYDAIVASAEHLRQDTKTPKRVLLVVTDGKDNASQDSLDETVRQLQQEGGPVVYVIAFLDDTKSASALMSALQTISQKTGGAAYFPRDLDEVDAITRGIGHDIRSQYVIGYKSSNRQTGHTYHTIDVEASDATHRKLRVRTRAGYYSESALASQ